MKQIYAMRSIAILAFITIVTLQLALCSRANAQDPQLIHDINHELNAFFLGKIRDYYNVTTNNEIMIEVDTMSIIYLPRSRFALNEFMEENNLVAIEGSWGQSPYHTSLRRYINDRYLLNDINIYAITRACTINMVALMGELSDGIIPIIIVPGQRFCGIGYIDNANDFAVAVHVEDSKIISISIVYSIEYINSIVGHNE